MTVILMYSLNGNPTVVGVSNGGIDFNVLNKEPQSFSITKTTITSATATAGDLKRVVYADSNGQKVAHSDANKSKTHESFANPSCFKNAINGGTGLTIVPLLVIYMSFRLCSLNDKPIA